MKQLIVCIAVLSIASGAHASESLQQHSHDHAAATNAQTAWGVPGEPSRARRTVEVRMGDNMRFEPAQITVKRGDTLGSIAARLLGSASKWKTLADLNKIRDPNKLKVGQVLKVP